MQYWWLGIATRVLKNPDILPTPKPGFEQSAKSAGFGFAFFCTKALCLMEYYTILDISKHVFD